MNLKEDFNKSFSYLMHNKKIIIPSFISFLIPFVLIILFIHMSGIFEFQQQLSASVTELEKMKDTNQLPFNQNSSAGSDSNITENEVYNSYMESRGVGFRDALKLVNFNNILLLVILILIWFVSSLYLSCMSYAIIAISLKEQITLRNLARMTNQYFLRLFSLRILIILIVIAPAFVLLGLLLFYGT